MHPSDPKAAVPARRKILGSLVTGAALLGLNAVGSAAATTMSDAGQEPGVPEELFAMAKLRNYKSRRSSSWDRTGGNNDSVHFGAPGETTMLEVSGAGVVTHIWMTINSKDRMHLKNLVLRAWWDGESTPSIEVPIGDFFGLGLGIYYIYESALLTVAPIKALNAYFQMPFSSAARITVSNEGSVPVDNFYFAVDYVTLPSLPSDVGRFHAQYRQAIPTKGWTNDWVTEYEPLVNDRKNLDGKDNYVILEATGKGHFLGVTQTVLQNRGRWFGEGDDMIFIDGDTLPTINGTGTEDYYNGAWDFGEQTFNYARNGAPFMENAEQRAGQYSLYRWHTESPIAFEKSIRVTMEHGHANHRSDDYFTTAYWYQTEPHAAFPALPMAADRIPRMVDLPPAPGADKPSK